MVIALEVFPWWKAPADHGAGPAQQHTSQTHGYRGLWGSYETRVTPEQLHHQSPTCPRYSLWAAAWGPASSYAPHLCASAPPSYLFLISGSIPHWSEREFCLVTVFFLAWHGYPQNTPCAPVKLFAPLLAVARCLEALALARLSLPLCAVFTTGYNSEFCVHQRRFIIIVIWICLLDSIGSKEKL